MFLVSCKSIKRQCLPTSNGTNRYKISLRVQTARVQQLHTINIYGEDGCLRPNHVSEVDSFKSCAIFSLQSSTLMEKFHFDTPIQLCVCQCYGYGMISCTVGAFDLFLQTVPIISLEPERVGLQSHASCTVIEFFLTNYDKIFLPYSSNGLDTGITQDCVYLAFFHRICDLSIYFSSQIIMRHWLSSVENFEYDF